METLITIRPFELENREIRKNTTRIPGTIRKSQINNEVASKFRKFDKVKKGVISSDVLYSIKPELIISFPKYEKKLSLSEVLKRLAISNALISEKYGKKDLKVTPKQLDMALTDALEKRNIDLLSYKSMQEKQRKLYEEKFSSLEQQIKEKDEKIKEQQKQIIEFKRKEIVYTTVIKEYEDNEQLENDIKLIA